MSDSTEIVEKKKVTKIAFLNPYLAAGHVNTAEIETTARLVQAGKNLNIEIRPFESCEEIEYFSPDFVMIMCFQAAKLTKFPTYGNMDVPPSMISHVPRFVRNVLTWDGVYTTSAQMEHWLGDICLLNDKKFHLAHASHTVPATVFKPADYKHAVAMYIGTNWDGQRHKNLFELLKTGKYVKCYGPRRSWSKYPVEFYGGEIPFDGVSVLDAYNKSGAGLCIGHAAFDKEGVPSSRTFEIAAASAVPICSDTELNRRIYGDAAYYVNHEADTQELADQIIESVQKIRNSPGISKEMAYQAHAIFNTTLSMEVFLAKIIEMHERVVVDNHHKRSENKTISPVIKKKVTYLLAVKYVDYRLEPILKNFSDQSFTDFEIILLAKNGQEAMQEKYASYYNKLPIICMPDVAKVSRQKLLSYLKINQTEWLGIITLSGRIFQNHIAELMNAFGSKRYDNEVISAVYSSSLEFSHDIHLPELEPEEHIVANQYRIRMASRKLRQRTPVHSMLINYDLLSEDIFNAIDYYCPYSEVLMKRLEMVGILRHVPEVTCATQINNDSDLLNQVKILEKTKAEMQAVINAQNITLADLEVRSQMLDVLYQSRSWRYTAFIRHIVKALNVVRYLKKLGGHAV